MSASLALADLKAFTKKGRVSDLLRFYKTAPGEYGEGDLFLGGTEAGGEFAGLFLGIITGASYRGNPNALAGARSAIRQ